MKRWHLPSMLEIGQKLFAKMYKRKQRAHPNHELHFMARELDQWLPEGIQSLIEGSYTPRHLKRFYFKDEMVDQLHPSDRILQHLILRQLKPTFPKVMNPNCFHLHGPSGVKLATERLRQVLQDEKPQFVIRADIKSYYKSIQHHKLIQDIKQYYDDPKLQAMLENVITNPIETPRGYKNPGYGVALRGPLSQFFSGLFLKKLDDAFDNMDLTYLRYQDDLVVLCKTKRQLNRARRRMMEILHEKGLQLSRKKSRIGSIEKGFHFLGIDYPGTRPQSNTKVAQAKNDQVMATPADDASIVIGGGGSPLNEHSLPVSIRIRPHPRTFRNAREKVRQMVANGFDIREIRTYLKQWALWWTMTSSTWQYAELLKEFFDTCWDIKLAVHAAGILLKDRAFFLLDREVLQKQRPSPLHASVVRSVR